LPEFARSTKGAGAPVRRSRIGNKTSTQSTQRYRGNLFLLRRCKDLDQLVIPKSKIAVCSSASLRPLYWGLGSAFNSTVYCWKHLH